MTDSAAADQTTDADFLCVGCGYLLRGIDAEGVCPECALPVARSRCGDHLRDADPKWLGRLVLGQTMLAWGTLAIVISPFYFVIMGILTSSLGPALSVVDTLVTISGSIAMLGGLVAAVLGGFLMTTQDPREMERESPLAARVVCRWAFGALTVLTAFAIVLEALPLTMTAMEILRNLLVRLSIPIVVTATVLAWLRWVHLLGRRLRDTRICDLVRSVERHLATLVGCVLLHRQLSHAGLVPGPGANPFPVTGFPVLGTLINLFTIAVLIIGLVLLLRGARVLAIALRLRKALVQCRREAIASSSAG